MFAPAGSSGLEKIAPPGKRLLARVILALAAVPGHEGAGDDGDEEQDLEGVDQLHARSFPFFF
jgi:hypothetical protein